MLLTEVAGHARLALARSPEFRRSEGGSPGHSDRALPATLYGHADEARGGIFRRALDGGPFGHPASFSVAELRPLTIAQVARLLGYKPRHVTPLYDRWAAPQHDPTMPRVTTVPVAIGSGAKRAAKAVLWPVAA